MSAAPASAPRPSAPPPRFMDADSARRLVGLLRQRRRSGAVVQVLAANPGEGSSSLSRDIVLAAVSFGARTLLLDLDHPNGSQIDTLLTHFGLSLISSGTMKLGDGEVPLHRVGPPDLHVMEVDTGVEAVPPSSWIDLFKRLRAAFDLVVIDSAPFGVASDCLLRAPLVHTNLLVVQAEKTRIAVAQNLRDQILEAGGSIAGILLNRRRLHVPEIVYRRL